MAINFNTLLGKEGIAALVKTGIFLVVTGTATFLLMNVLANGLFRPLTQYKAEFTDTTNIAKGDDVRIAGVSVGSIKSWELSKDGKKSIVTFGVDPDVKLTENTTMKIRYRNLVGQRYMVLEQGSEGSSSALGEGDTIPLERTQEAVDIDTLFQGFKPVFQALSPDDTNKLAFEIVQTLQGESGTVKNLLATTGSLTSTLAERDQLIGDVIANLSETLDIVADRDAELGDTIDSLQAFVSGLNSDREAIFDSIDSISALSTETADLLAKSRAQLVQDIKELRATVAAYATEDNLAGLEQDFQILPYKMKKLTQVADAGSEFNFYLCGIQGTILDLPIQVIPDFGGPRCDRGDN